MRISEIDQEVSDFDWFAVDRDGYLVHFSSGGGRLPSSVAASKENLSLLETYFKSLPILSTEVDIFPALVAAAVPYSHLYLEYVCRGLHSYEAVLSSWPMGTAYQLVARSPRALMLSGLPIEIAKLVSKTQLGFSVIDLALLDTKTVA